MRGATDRFNTLDKNLNRVKMDSWGGGSIQGRSIENVDIILFIFITREVCCVFK